MLTRILLSVPLIASVVTSPGSAAAPAANTGLPAGVYRLQKASLLDQQGFGRPMTAVTLLIPAGWQASGGVVWQTNPQSCGKNPTRLEWRAVAPDGVSAVELLPEESWSGNNLGLPSMPGACPNITFTNVKDYLHWYAGRVRPGARILDYRDRSDTTESLKQFNRTDPGVAGELRMWVEGGEVLLSHTVAGREVRESLAGIVIFMLNRMSGVMPGEIREFLTISALPVVAVRAPNGQLDFNLAEMIRRSIKADPAWMAEMAKHNQAMSGIAAKGEADRHAIRMNTAREIAEINQRGYEDRQASLDRSHEEFVQTIRGVETYVDTTSNERVELPNNYDHVWRLNDDTYILTNDVNFQPGRDLGIEGRQLETAR